MAEKFQMEPKEKMVMALSLRWHSYPGKEEAEITWRGGEGGRRDLGADKFKS